MLQSEPGIELVHRHHADHQQRDHDVADPVGAAVIREREHGTIEHLLVTPVTPGEIMLTVEVSGSRRGEVAMSDIVSPA